MTETALVIPVFHGQQELQRFEALDSLRNIHEYHRQVNHKTL
jgi:hypothetical protein